MADHSDFVFYSAWVALWVGPLAGATTAFVWRRRATKPSVWGLIAKMSPLAVLVVATALGLTFIDVRLGAVAFQVAYIAYCCAAYVMARATVGLPSTFGWVLVAPTLGGVLLGTIGVVGLALMMGDLIPRAGGDLGRGYRYIVTTYGGATMPDGGSTVGVYKQMVWFPFLEQRIFEARFDYRDVDVGTVAVELEPSNDRRAVVVSGTVRLATVALE